MWEKEKLLVTSNFSFSHSVFKRLVLQTRKNQGLFGKGLIIYSLPIITEKNYNYNAISTVSDKYFFSHSVEGKTHSVLVIESDSEYLHLSPVNICLSSPVV